MRILHMISAMSGGGAEMLVKDLALELKRQGHEIGICYFSSAQQQGNSIELENTFISAFTQADIQMIELGHATRGNPLLAAYRLRQTAKQFQPDVIHIHLATGLVAFCISLLRTKMVYTHHSLKIKFSKSLFWFFDKWVSRYIAICDICKVNLESHVRRPVVLIRNAVDGARMIKRTRQYDGRTLKILSVGNIREPKNYPLLIAVAKIVKSKLAPHSIIPKFLVAGDGPLIHEMRTLCAQSGLTDTVEFLGPRKDVPRLMVDSDVLVMTSHYEGLPLTLIEALHAGLPIVATDVGGCSEVVVDTQNGYLRKAGDAEGISDALVALALSPDRLEQMAAQSRLRASLFSKAECVEAHLKLYNVVLESDSV